MKRMVKKIGILFIILLITLILYSVKVEAVTWQFKSPNNIDENKSWNWTWKTLDDGTPVNVDMRLQTYQDYGEGSLWYTNVFCVQYRIQVDDGNSQEDPTYKGEYKASDEYTVKDKALKYILHKRRCWCKE